MTRKQTSIVDQLFIGTTPNAGYERWGVHKLDTLGNAFT
jgi:hypothetical protein